MPVTGNNHHITLTLSIRLSADGFCFYVCNPQDNSLIRSERFVLSPTEDMADRLQSELSKQEYFNRNIDQVFVLSCSPSTRIPIEEFKREEAQALYELTFSLTDISQYHIIYNILPRLEAAELHRISRSVESIILQFYPTARFFGTNAMLLERLFHIEEEEKISEQRLYLCDLPEQFALFAFRDKRLIYANNFAKGTPNDSLYQILYAWKVLNMRAETDHLVIFSNDTIRANSLSQTSHLARLLSEYLAYIDPITPATLFPRVPLAYEKNIPVDLITLLLNRL